MFDDIHLMADDFIEADGGVHNIRVFNNRGVNAAHCVLSGQPVFGGPAYYIRNVVYHVGSGPAFKFFAKPAGLIVYHNTIVTENRMRDLNSNAHFRNNLFLGTEGRNIMNFPNATSYSSFDYNGYRPNRGVEGQYLWLAPATSLFLARAAGLQADQNAVLFAFRLAQALPRAHLVS